MKRGDTAIYKRHKVLVCEVVDNRVLIYLPHKHALEWHNTEHLKSTKPELTQFNVTDGGLDINDLSEMEAKRLLKFYITKLLDLQAIARGIANIEIKHPKWVVDLESKS